MRAVLFAATFAALQSISVANAQTYPARQITMMVPSVAGGPTDAIARLIAERMQASLGQPVVIENMGGAGGTIGMTRLARAGADGYTIGIGHWAHYVLSGAIYKVQYDLLRDFEPVALISTGPQVIVTRKDFPANDLNELINWLRANPGKANAGTGAASSPPNVFGVQFQKLTGSRFESVPYRGSGPALQAMMAGQIDLMIDLASNSAPQINTGTIKAFAVTAPHRLAAIPAVPTVDEAGLPGFYASVWHAMWAPRGTPKSHIDKINAAVVEALSDPALSKRLVDLGQQIPSREQQTPEALGKFHRAEIEQWWPIIRSSGIKAE